MKTKAKLKAVPLADRLDWLKKQIHLAMASRITSIERIQKYRQMRRVFAKRGPEMSMNQRCFACLGQAEIRHHITPLILGGQNKLNNIVPLCKACHEEVHTAGPRALEKPQPDYSGGAEIQALLRQMYA